MQQEICGKPQILRAPAFFKYALQRRETPSYGSILEKQQESGGVSLQETEKTAILVKIETNVKSKKKEVMAVYGLSDSLKPLSAAEEQVLLAVWSCKPPASRRDIGERLAEKGWKPATVLNFLYRLEAKGWVKSGKDQNRNIYTPTITKRAYSVWIMRERLDAVFGGDVAAAVRALVSESGCSQSQLEQAIAVLEEKHAEAEEYDLYDPYG